MNLAIDVGNTNSKYAFFDENQITESGIIGSLAAFKSFLSDRSGDFERAIVCSVRYTESELLPFFKENQRPVYLSHHTPVPLTMAYKTPETLGMDRLAAAVGGNYLFSGSGVMVIDIGTCITYDYVSEEGVFEGGVISPGVELRYKAMHDYTARLPLLTDREADGLIGVNTRSAMKSGVVNGIVGEIEYMISQFLLKTPDFSSLFFFTYFYFFL